MYDPSVGRWLSEDPIGFEALDPNRYRYVDNMPTNAVDPSGLTSIMPVPPMPIELTPRFLNLNSIPSVMDLVVLPDEMEAENK